jgi:hypothetical protein
LIPICRHTVIFCRFYYVINLLKNSLPHQMVCYIKVSASVYHGGILLCECTETNVNSDRDQPYDFCVLIKAKKKNCWGISSTVSWSIKCFFYVGAYNHKKKSYFSESQS